MLSLTENEIDDLLSGIGDNKNSSNLGFFSRPFRINHRDKELIVKLYLPVKKYSSVSSIIENHNEYIKALKSTGIKIPDTLITVRKLKNKFKLIIIQESFKDVELLRNLVQSAYGNKLTDLCEKIFDDTLKFWKNRKESMDIGFHPTLRNYSLHNSELYYFDTFPPMLMNQRKLNRLILMMSPYGGLVNKFIPLWLINRVSDEYYNLDKMFIGIVGSCCRLKPDDAHKILAFSNEFVKRSALLSKKEKESILKLIQAPPNLSKIWLLIRKLSGNTGKPNLKAMHVKK